MGASTLDAAGLKGSFHRSKLLLKSGRIEAQVKRALICFPYPQKRSQSICFAGKGVKRNLGVQSGQGSFFPGPLPVDKKAKGQ
jgi:hypothetical protein